MIFSTKAEYGVRLMIQLGRQGGGAAGVAEGGRRGREPAALLPRAPRRAAAKAGLVEATRGAHGGYRWRGPPRRSRWSRSSRRSRARSRRWSASTTTARARVLCSHETDGDDACATKLLWTRVQGGVTKALAGTTLAELVEFAEQPATRPRRPPAPPTTGDPWLTSRSATCTSAAEDKEILKGVDLDVEPGRDPRADGPERLRQVDARQRDHGPPRPRGHRGPDPLQRRGHHRGRPRRARPRRACSWPSSTRSRSPA